MGGIKVSMGSFQWTQHVVAHSPSSSKALASVNSSPSSRRRSFSSIDGALGCRYVHCSPFFGAQPSKLFRTQSCDQYTKTRTPLIRRAISASLESFSDEEFSKELQELAMKFQVSDEEDGESSVFDSEEELVPKSMELHNQNGIGASVNEEMKILENRMHFDLLEPPDWHERVEIIPASIEMRANSVELPVSLRMIKKKKQWSGGLMVAGESAYCSVKKAFSSMVFIIRELQCFTLQMREVLFYEDLQGIVSRVQSEMQASFVWLFQQVFSCTPSLMVYVMILLANYSVHSMANSAAIAAVPPPQAYASTMESISMVEDHSFGKQDKFDASAIKSYLVSFSTGKTTSIGGGSGGGGNYKPVAGGTDGDGRFDGSISFGYHQTELPDGVSSGSNLARTSEEPSVSGQKSWEEELELWNKVVVEASGMQASTRNEALDHETLQSFVSPVNVKIEADDYEDYFRTELLYQTGLAQEPENPLLLANYAQFLYLVAQDYDRAEDYFKKAVVVEPKDAEALNKYASFLWKVRNDLWAAEETYQEAIAAEPSNSFYAANYANFLWNTGGEDTCFPLTSTEGDTDI
ncbi:hypothetical protein Leryth_014418 [Lithospermum erythrorhizon]|uniref:Tetratricopeptide repeat-like superfamily protein n=1 Tax=Lithospermum erythrorhizon TaxID=34254 RepID=A0AAV3NZ31_LITER|nr:hypothetical protein Leryth_014418 [Lithospermum erythrorhizon]